VRALNIFALQLFLPFSHDVCIKDNNSLDNDDYLPSSLMDIVKEPCSICDGSAGTYDIIAKSMDDEEEVESWWTQDRDCSEEIDYIINIFDFISLPSVGECKEVEERCAVCHNRTYN